jgi:16S rRNA (adenine1518-N6/adenine1519-N6)-dimethyltransferase
MNDLSEIAIIHQWNVRPKKSLGQSFLIDRNIAEKLAGAISRTKARTIIEIGAGTGSLTRSLLAEGLRVVAVELDHGLCRVLSERFMANSNLRVIERDFLDMKLWKMAKEENLGRMTVAGNIPYNITSPLISKLIDGRDVVRGAFLMIQREFAKRLVSEPGTRDYGAVTVGTGLYAETNELFDVKRTSFFPKPEVDSTVVELHIEKVPRVPLADEKTFELVKTSAFQQRRKMLRSSLCSIPGVNKQMLNDVQKRSGIDLSRRGETLTISEMAALADSISRLI